MFIRLVCFLVFFGVDAADDTFSEGYNTTIGEHGFSVGTLSAFGRVRNSISLARTYQHMTYETWLTVSWKKFPKRISILSNSIQNPHIYSCFVTQLFNLVKSLLSIDPSLRDFLRINRQTSVGFCLLRKRA